MRSRSLFAICFRHPVVKYMTAVLAAVVAVLIRRALNPVLDDQSRYLFVIPVMIVWAIFAGVGAGALSATVGAVLTMLLVVAPQDHPSSQRTDANAFIVMCLMCAGFLWVIDREVKEKRRREQTEAELEQLNQALELKVAERTSELRAANAELEGFCYSMAHDLRTPSRAVAGHARILLEDHGDHIVPDIRHHVVRIHRAAHKMGALIDAMLLYARLAHYEIRFSDVNLTRLVTELAGFEANEAAAEVRVDAQEDIFVRADERLMRTLFGALVSNAITYRLPDRPAKIRMRLQDGCLSFEDEGIGFDMAYEAKVFLPFERLHRDEQYPGVGMGLANVARIVARHGGDASIEAAPGRGTTVRLRLPGLAARSGERAEAASGVR